MPFGWWVVGWAMLGAVLAMILTLSLGPVCIYVCKRFIEGRKIAFREWDEVMEGVGVIWVAFFSQPVGMVGGVIWAIQNPTAAVGTLAPPLFSIVGGLLLPVWTIVEVQNLQGYFENKASRMDQPPLYKEVFSPLLPPLLISLTLATLGVITSGARYIVYPGLVWALGCLIWLISRR